ncbi:unnamed protein product [Callosobruchus maculatus]|uniref:Uncharacterized protein n=1 Tax=Callosobruchus maculatus TaxID=64391 RepID=A0A653BEP2_CALMS|nr:unnamed protein product [Callosobruchus maculatus]
MEFQRHHPYVPAGMHLSWKYQHFLGSDSSGYGSDEFGTSQQPHDGSPRYTSPGGGPAAAPAGYYIGADGAPAPGQPTAAGGAAAAADWPPTPYTAYQTYEAYGLIPETDTAAGAGSQGLPPMSSLRPNGAAAQAATTTAAAAACTRRRLQWNQLVLAATARPPRRQFPRRPRSPPQPGWPRRPPPITPVPRRTPPTTHSPTDLLRDYTWAPAWKKDWMTP